MKRQSALEVPHLKRERGSGEQQKEAAIFMNAPTQNRACNVFY